MLPESSITYIGPRELQNGHIVSFQRSGDRATVRIRDVGGRQLTIHFAGVADFAAVHPEGMLLHGIAELRPADAGQRDTIRHFIFANEEEWDDAYLEIAAREFWLVEADVEEAVD